MQHDVEFDRDETSDREEESENSNIENLKEE